MSKIKAKWLRLTAETNALDFLERAGQFILKTEESPIFWKWVVLSLHSALYGFAICACKGTNPDNVVFRTKKGERKLIRFDDALKKCQDDNLMNMLYGSKALVLSRNQVQSIELLKKQLRNNFEHYIPKGWSIELHGLPRMTIDVLNVIRFLAVETGTYIHLNTSQIRKVKSIVFKSKRFGVPLFSRTLS